MPEFMGGPCDGLVDDFAGQYCAISLEDDVNYGIYEFDFETNHYLYRFIVHESALSQVLAKYPTQG